MHLLLTLFLLTAPAPRIADSPVPIASGVPVAPVWREALPGPTRTAAEVPTAAGQQVVTGTQSAGQAAAPSAEVQRLRTQLDRAIASPGWPAARWGVLVTSLDHGDTLYAHSPAEPLVPASNMKLFTSAAALYYLGPRFRFTTYLIADGPVRDGVLHGDLIIYGMGDPTLADRFHPDKLAVFEAFADSLAALGIREIRGSVVGDASYWGPALSGNGWRENYMSAWYAAPSSALSYNENVVTLHVRPGSEAGWRPQVELSPGGEGIAIVNQATTVARGGSDIEVDRVAYDGPILVRGEVSRGQPGIWRQVPVGDPPRYTAAVFKEVLDARGIEVLGGIGSIQRPADSPVGGRQVFAPTFEARPPVQVLVAYRSPPLLEILEVVNQVSHNLYAEQMLRTVGKTVVGDASVEGGARAVRQFLEQETGRSSVAIEDGSGLSALNRASAEDFVALLAYMAESPLSADFSRTLPRAGERRLRRMVGTPAEQNLRAKTGTIDAVSSLSGYVNAANGERLAFSIIGNNVPSTWRAKRVEDAVGARLGAFDRPPPPTTTAAAAPAAPDAEPTPVSRPVDVPGPATPARYHEIRRGDTLEGIARRYGTTVRALQDSNPGVEPRRLMPGQRLRLP